MDITLVCIGKTRRVTGTIGRQVEKKEGESAREEQKKEEKHTPGFVVNRECVDIFL